MQNPYSVEYAAQNLSRLDGQTGWVRGVSEECRGENCLIRANHLDDAEVLGLDPVNKELEAEVHSLAGQDVLLKGKFDAVCSGEKAICIGRLPEFRVIKVRAISE